jgi:hypothetical protein
MKPVTKELPMMKSETIELKKATKELAVINKIQMTKRKKRNALKLGANPTSQYEGTTYRVASNNRKGRKTIVLART